MNRGEGREKRSHRGKTFLQPRGTWGPPDPLSKNSNYSSLVPRQCLIGADLVLRFMNSVADRDRPRMMTMRRLCRGRACPARRGRSEQRPYVHLVPGLCLGMSAWKLRLPDPAGRGITRNIFPGGPVRCMGSQAEHGNQYLKKH